MRYELTQKLFAIGNDFGVKDETGREVMYVDGKKFSFGRKFVLLDNRKREIAVVKQKVFSFRSTFRVTRDGKFSAAITKKGFGFRPQFLIDLPGSNDYTIVGDFVGQEYSFKRDSRDVARVSKRFFSSTDSYGVDIESGDPILILCATVVVDLILHSS